MSWLKSGTSVNLLMSVRRMTGLRLRLDVVSELFRLKQSSPKNSTLSTDVVVVFVCRTDGLRFLGRIGVSDLRWPDA